MQMDKVISSLEEQIPTMGVRVTCRKYRQNGDLNEFVFNIVAGMDALVGRGAQDVLKKLILATLDLCLASKEFMTIFQDNIESRWCAASSPHLAQLGVLLAEYWLSSANKVNFSMIRLVLRALVPSQCYAPASAVYSRGNSSAIDWFNVILTYFERDVSPDQSFLLLLDFLVPYHIFEIATEFSNASRYTIDHSIHDKIRKIIAKLSTAAQSHITEDATRALAYAALLQHLEDAASTHTNLSTDLSLQQLDTLITIIKHHTTPQQLPALATLAFLRYSTAAATNNHKALHIHALLLHLLASSSHTSSQFSDYQNISHVLQPWCSHRQLPFLFARITRLESAPARPTKNTRPALVFPSYNTKKLSLYQQSTMKVNNKPPLSSSSSYFYRPTTTPGSFLS